MYSLNAQGFITNWLVAGPHCQPLRDVPKRETGADQLRYEAMLRTGYEKRSLQQPPKHIALGAMAPVSQPWRYVRAGNWFVDESTFYSSLTDVALDAVTELVVEKQQAVSAVLWTYAAVDLWLNDECVCRVEKPVYKPIIKKPFSLNLKPGVNRIYMQIRTLGVRDTRTIAGIQLMDTQGIVGILPDKAHVESLWRADRWLGGIKAADGQLLCPSVPDFKAWLNEENMPIESTKVDLKGQSRARVYIQTSGETLFRDFELIENVQPLYRLKDDPDWYYKMLAPIPYQMRSNGITFSVFYVLARYALGVQTETDEALLFKDLDAIEKRVDCSDFVMAGLFRLMKNYPLSDGFKARIHEVFLNYRYWMDEEGADGMCFWSENHALLFHSAQMLAGELYPNERFLRGGRTGAQQAEIGAFRCREWLKEALEKGIEEFNSATYLPITMVALMNLVDFGPEDMAKDAAALADELFHNLCLHVFDGACISPQGRVYRDVIYPHRQSVQAMLNYFFPDLPYSDGENMWSVVFKTCAYHPPEDLQKLMKKPATLSYTSGNGRIRLNKNEHFMLTSVDCPRAQDDAPDWVNLCFVEGAEQNSNAYVKSLNERFHGTTVFEPGVFGYQQHLWYAALSRECVVFTTLPGSAIDFDHMRPGYWHGNGVFPAVKQEGNRLGTIFVIPDDYPIRFTHLFWPEAKFDQTLRTGHWLIGHCRNGAVGIWCSGQLEKVDMALSNCEYRCYDAKTAYLCVMDACENQAEFEAFTQKVTAINVTFDSQRNELKGGDGLVLTYVAKTNLSQYI